MTSFRIFLIADDPLARAGLAALVSEMLDCQVVGQSSSEDLDEGLDEDLISERPDVIIWDRGWEAEAPTFDLRDLEAPVVMLVADESGAAEAWAAGGRVLLRRDGDPEKVLAAVRAAAANLIVIDTKLAEAILPAPLLATDAPPAELTPREVEVLHLVAEGLTNKAIARQLGISAHTVKFHVNAAMTKLGAQSRTEAVVRATKFGFITL
ncbi:MAG: LuxR family transcriptional regulator [Anaerolineae bacterium]